MAEMRMKKPKLFKAALRPEGRPYYFLIQDKALKSVSKFGTSFQIEIFPSLQCNVNCHYCHRGNEKSILRDFNDIKILYDNLRKDAIFNVENFTISGSEPTIYPKINELISFLYNLNPYGKIDFITNLLEFERIKKHHLEKLNLAVSIYPYTIRILQKNKYIKNLLKRMGIPLEVNIFFHENMKAYGTAKRRNFDPISECLKATLLCATKRVYPCCRAHTLEQMHTKNYHYCIDTPGLYNKLKAIIRNTDLCNCCPGIYKNPVLIPLTKLKL